MTTENDTDYDTSITGTEYIDKLIKEIERIFEERENTIKRVKMKDIKVVVDKDFRIYSCVDCGIMRSENEGGKIFTVCDECWDKYYGKQIKNKL